MAVTGIDTAAVEETFDEALAAELITALPKRSVALQSLPVIPMGTKTSRIPVLSALPTASFLNGSQAVKPASSVSWDKVLLTAEEIAVIIPIAEDAIEDSSLDVVGRTTDLIVQEFGRVLDAAVFFGTGAPATFPTDGIYGNAYDSVAATAQIADDLNDLFALVEDLDEDVDRVFAARALRTALRGQKDGNGAPIYVPSMGAANVSEIYGVPTRFPLGWDKTSALAIAMNSACAVIGLRSDVKTKILTEATLTDFGNLAEKDSIAIRAVMRVGFQLANPVSLENAAGELPIAAYTPAGS